VGLLGPRLIIPRSEAEILKSVDGWILVYGRRKTGKTFLIRNFIEFDSYYFVTRSIEVFSYNKELEKISYEVFMDRMRREIREEKTIVVDEFQRLPQEFLDFLHFAKSFAKAKLILVGSSFNFTNRILSSGSPILGIVYPVKLGLIKPRDVLAALSKYYEPNEALLLSSILRDPVIVEDLQPGESINEFLRRVIPKIRVTVRSLIGEIFDEEGRELSQRYEAILRAVAAGCKRPSEVASHISGILRTPLKSQDVKKYLRNLVEMGILRRIKILGRDAHFYFMESPIIDMYYYLDLKTGFSEVNVPVDVLVSHIERKLPLYYEMFIVDLLADAYGCEVVKSFHPEVDGILIRGKEAVAAVEVKMGTVSKADVKRFIEKTRDISDRRIVIARNKISEKNVECLTPSELLEIVRAKN